MTNPIAANVNLSDVFIHVSCKKSYILSPVLNSGIQSLRQSRSGIPLPRFNITRGAASPVPVVYLFFLAGRVSGKVTLLG
jgi:hypothetical protein